MGHELPPDILLQHNIQQTQGLFSDMLRKERGQGAEHEFLRYLRDGMGTVKFNVRRELEFISGKPTVEYVLRDKDFQYKGKTSEREKSGIIIGDMPDGKVAYAHGYSEWYNNTWTTVELYQARRRDKNFKPQDGAETHSSQAEQLLQSAIEEHSKRRDHGLFLLVENRRKTHNEDLTASAVYRLGGKPLSWLMYYEFFLEAAAFNDGTTTSQFKFKRNMMPEFHGGFPVSLISDQKPKTSLNQWWFNKTYYDQSTDEVRNVKFATSKYAEDVAKSILEGYNISHKIIELSRI